MSDIGWDPFDFFREGGFAMYLVACVGGLGHVMAIAALGSMMAKRRAMPLGMGAATLLFSLSTLCVGVLGYFMAMRNVEGAIAAAPPEYADQFLTQGREEADNNLYFGGCAFLFPLLAGAAAIARGATMKDGPPSA